MSNIEEELDMHGDGLIEILLDFIIVMATLAKKTTRVIRENKPRKGENSNGTEERIRERYTGPSERSCRY